MIHDTVRGGEDELAKRTSGQEIGRALLELTGTDVETGRDDTGLVDAAIQLDDDLARAVVVDELEFIDIACKDYGVSFIPNENRNEDRKMWTPR